MVFTLLSGWPLCPPHPPFSLDKDDPYLELGRLLSYADFKHDDAEHCKPESDLEGTSTSPWESTRMNASMRWCLSSSSGP